MTDATTARRRERMDEPDDLGPISATPDLMVTRALAFADACLRAKNGEANIVECTYVESKITDAAFFASKVTLGRDGVDTIHGLGSLTAYEQANLDAMIPQLQGEIKKGIDFVKGA